MCVLSFSIAAIALFGEVMDGLFGLGLRKHTTRLRAGSIVHRSCGCDSNVDGHTTSSQTDRTHTLNEKVQLARTLYVAGLILPTSPEVAKLICTYSVPRTRNCSGGGVSVLSFAQKNKI